MDFEKLSNVEKKYEQGSIIKRMEAFFLDNLGLIVTREQLMEVSTDPKTGVTPENWHQRLSELRVNKGYTILSKRDVPSLKASEYVMPDSNKRETAKSRKAINAKIRKQLIEINPYCAFDGCNLKDGSIDPIGGGTVKLQVDHMTPLDYKDMGEDKLENYQLLCGRHNVIKKNLWDDLTGKLNTIAILQFLSNSEKAVAYNWLKKYFGDN